MLLNNPRTQHYQEIEALSLLLLLNLKRGGTPSALEGCLYWLWHQSHHAHRLKEASPKLSSKDTQDQEVVDTFELLVTKRALLEVIQTPLCKFVSSSASIMLH
jgi:hypothetical protein